MRNRIHGFCTLALIWIGGGGLALAQPETMHQWSNIDGKTVEAEFLRIQEGQVVLRLKERKEATRVPLDKLSPESAALARRLAAENAGPQADQVTGSGSFTIDGKMIERGKRTDVTVPIIGEKGLKELAEIYGKPTKVLKVGVLVPPDFDVTSRNSLAVICHSTTSGGGLSLKAMGNFQKAAAEAGAVVLAVDGEFGHPGKKDTPHFRSWLVYLMLEALKKSHPASEFWRYIHAGHSGGAGYASYVSLYMQSADYNVAGVFLSAGNYSPVMYEKNYRIKTEEKKKLPIYYSFGTNDPVCKPAMQKEVLNEMRRSSFKNHRVSYHENNHGMWEPHFREALDWFKDPATN